MRPFYFFSTGLKCWFDRVLPIGTRSLLFGTHQFFLHPLFVTMAWRDVHGHWPGWRETICIILHDIGYLGCTTLDGPDGKDHPERGARVANKLFGPTYRDLILYHSRSYARKHNQKPSALNEPDKVALEKYPVWLYLFLAHLSGEIHEYRQQSAETGEVPVNSTDQEWFKTILAQNRKQFQSTLQNAKEVSHEPEIA